MNGKRNCDVHLYTSTSTQSIIHPQKGNLGIWDNNITLKEVKSDRKTWYDLSYLRNVKKAKHTGKEHWLVADRGQRERSKMGEGGQKVQTSSYQTSKFWKCNIQHGDYNKEYSTINLKVAKSTSQQHKSSLKNVQNATDIFPNTYKLPTSTWKHATSTFFAIFLKVLIIKKTSLAIQWLRLYFHCRRCRLDP